MAAVEAVIAAPAAPTAPVKVAAPCTWPRCACDFPPVPCEIQWAQGSAGERQ